MAYLGVMTKQPAEGLPVDIDYSTVLAGRVGAVAGLPSVTAPAGIVVDEMDLSGNVFRFYVRGGTDKSAYTLEITASLSVGGTTEPVQDELVVLVREAQPSDRLAEINTLLPLILPYTPGCPDITAMSALQQAAIEFFQRSLAWRSVLAVATTEAVSSYYFPTPPGTVVAKLLDAWVDGEPVPVVTMDGGRVAAIEAINSAVWTNDRTTFEVRPVPGALAKAVSVFVALKPTQGSTLVAADQLEQHAEALAAGALARLHAMTGKQWHSPPEAARRRGEFDDAVACLQDLSARGFSRAPFRTKGIWM